MALLYRFAQLPDRGGTRVFSFVITRNVRDLERDFTSKEWVCGFQKWSIALSRGDKVLGAYLVWRSASQDLRVYVDFTFTLLNREHFSMNESFSGKRVKFTYKAPAQGNRNYIAVSDLYNRNFADLNGEFQLELSMSNVQTVYMAEIRMPTGVFSSGQPKQSKVETGCFPFGCFDWQVTIYPHGRKDTEVCCGTEPRVSVYLVRQSGFDHPCKVRYSVSLGEGDRCIDSGQIEDLSDAEGEGFGWHPRMRWADIAHKGVLTVKLEMIEARTISEVCVPALGRPTLPPAQCYDRDKQAWTIRTDFHSKKVRFHLVFKDIHNVPRNHLKYVNWSAYLVRVEDGEKEVISLLGSPFSRYYAQEPTDEGIMMETSLLVKDVKENHCPFLNAKGQLTVRIEWNESHTLFQATYHKYDEVCRIHNQQMRREIASLTEDNDSLERQLFSYQKSLAYAQAQQQNQQHHASHRDHHLERSASTDTEYA